MGKVSGGAGRGGGRFGAVTANAPSASDAQLGAQRERLGAGVGFSTQENGAGNTVGTYSAQIRGSDGIATGRLTVAFAQNDYLNTQVTLRGGTYDQNAGGLLQRAGRQTARRVRQFLADDMREHVNGHVYTVRALGEAGFPQPTARLLRGMGFRVGNYEAQGAISGGRIIPFGAGG